MSYFIHIFRVRVTIFIFIDSLLDFHHFFSKINFVCLTFPLNASLLLPLYVSLHLYLLLLHLQRVKPLSTITLYILTLFRRTLDS